MVLIHEALAGVTLPSLEDGGLDIIFILEVASFLILSIDQI